MRLCFSSFAHLLVLVAVSDVAFGSLLTLLTNASRMNIDQPRLVNRVKHNTKPVPDPKKEFIRRFTTTWAEIREHPPDSVEVAVGSRVELRCGVFGNPPPKVYWIAGKEPEMQSQELLAWIEEASSSVPEGGPTFVYSTYVIDCVRPEDQGFKYCVTFSKNTVEIAATALLVNSTKVECNKESQPTITLHQRWRFALKGTTIILPCKFVGQPTSYLFWIDNRRKTIDPATHMRHTVLPNGDLEIRDLQWEDMGVYTCIVQWGYTKKNATTFVYPLGSEESNKNVTEE